LLIGGTDGCPDCLEGSLDLRDFKNLLGLNCYNENNDPAFKITEIDLLESQNVYILNVEIEGEKLNFGRGGGTFSVLKKIIILLDEGKIKLHAKADFLETISRKLLYENSVDTKEKNGEETPSHEEVLALNKIFYRVIKKYPLAWRETEEFQKFYAPYSKYQKGLGIFFFMLGVSLILVYW
jgi:hypothetical protein